MTVASISASTGDSNKDSRSSNKRTGIDSKKKVIAKFHSRIVTAGIRATRGPAVGQLGGVLSRALED